MNSETGFPTHLDGAIRAYTDEQLAKRIDTTIDKSERNTLYTKLWRIDGDMPIELWKNLITQFYRDNRQVGEYLGGEDEKLDQILSDKEKKRIKDPIKDFIPVNFVVGNGIRCFYGRRHPIGMEEWDIQAVSNETALVTDEEYINVMELETITILKRMKRLGYSVNIPHTYLTQTEDLITNLPIFYCKDSKIAAAVIKTINEFCEIWITNGDDRVLTFSVDFNSNDSGVHLSFAGHIKDLHLCISNVGTSLLESGDFNSWINKLYQVNNTYTHANQNPKVYELLTQSFELYITRKAVPMEMMKQMISGRGKVSIDEAKYNLMKDNSIDVAWGYIFSEVICEKCQNDYCLCNCIKFIDDTRTQIKKIKTCSLTWTNRHA